MVFDRLEGIEDETALVNELYKFFNESIRLSRTKAARQYLKFHEMICEKPEFLGMSNHLLYIGRK